MALGIEFKNGSINLVEARVRKNEVICKGAYSFVFDDDWIDQQGITEYNFDNFALLLEQKLDEFDIQDKKEAYICLNNSSIIYREIITPKIDHKKLAFIVRSEMMDTLNLTADYIMDYITLEEVEDENGQPALRVLAVAVLERALESYIELMKHLRIKPLVIDSATNSVIKTVKMNKEIYELDQVILTEIGSNHLRLYLFDQGNYILSRNVRLIAYSELTKEEYLDTIEDNIGKMIQFSYTRGIKSGIDKIYLLGKDEVLEEMKERVNHNLLVPCEIFARPSFVSGDCEHQTQFINVFGSMLRK